VGREGKILAKGTKLALCRLVCPFGQFIGPFFQGGEWPICQQQHFVPKPVILHKGPRKDWDMDWIVIDGGFGWGNE
jgi:hypothetical protein